ncbi:MAG: permease, partial [Candidatus Marinimicrobia bacterium]|nr:permease [Candidatus Neomarinimicrobiota bacterium]
MIIELLQNFLNELWSILAQMGPYLLFGFLVAGILSVYIQPEWVERHLGGTGIMPAIKASLFGVPLPLCSCGVIPVSAGIYRHGASKSATISFLLSTPQTGVDSIFVTYGMLGPIYAIFRPIVALFTGIIGGAIVQMVDNSNHNKTNSIDTQEVSRESADTDNSNKFYRVFKYGFINLPKDIGKALIVGILIASAMGALVPPEYLGGLIGSGFISILILMAAGVPVYVCATASVPIAAGFLHMGASPG